MESIEENLKEIRRRLHEEGYHEATPIKQDIKSSRGKDAQEICDVLLGKTPQGNIRLNHVFEGNWEVQGKPFYGSSDSKEDMDAAFIKIANLCGKKVWLGTPVPKL